MPKIHYTIFSKRYVLRMMGGRVEDIEQGEADEYGTFDTLDAAISDVLELIADEDDAKLIDQRGAGIGAIEHTVYYIDAFAYDADIDEWLPCDRDGNTNNWMDAISLYYHDMLDDAPKLKIAWDKAVTAKRKYLDYEAEEFYTVRAFLSEMDE